MQAVGQRLTARYVDECVEQGRNEMVPMKGHIARRAKELVDDGVPVEEVELAIHEFVRRRGRTALQLAEIVVELRREGSPDPLERPSAVRAAREWVDTNGWPTGAFFRRGTHSGTYVYYALGTERVPSGYEWPYGKPSWEEIVHAVAAAEEGGSYAR